MRDNSLPDFIKPVLIVVNMMYIIIFINLCNFHFQWKILSVVLIEYIIVLSIFQLSTERREKGAVREREREREGGGGERGRECWKEG